MIKSYCSINLSGIISTSTVHQGFYLIADVTVFTMLVYLIHCFGVILSRNSQSLYEELTVWFASGGAAVLRPNVLCSITPIQKSTIATTSMES